MNRRMIGTLLGLTLCLTLISTAVGSALPLRTVSSSSMGVTDVTDDRKLAGVAHNVFVGTVTGLAGAKAISGYPETQFRVRVLENIKGQLTDTVVVNQQSGYEGPTLVLMDGDPLLTVGKTYLFATRPLPAMGWHTLIPVYGDILVTSDAHRTALTARFAEAVKQAIPLEHDPLR